MQMFGLHLRPIGSETLGVKSKSSSTSPPGDSDVLSSVTAAGLAHSLCLAQSLASDYQTFLPLLRETAQVLSLKQLP